LKRGGRGPARGPLPITAPLKKLKTLSIGNA
jgi:hypothetical protein